MPVAASPLPTEPFALAREQVLELEYAGEMPREVPYLAGGLVVGLLIGVAYWAHAFSSSGGWN